MDSSARIFAVRGIFTELYTQKAIVAFLKYLYRVNIGFSSGSILTADRAEWSLWYQVRYSFATVPELDHIDG